MRPATADRNKTKPHRRSQETLGGGGGGGGGEGVLSLNTCRGHDVLADGSNFYFFDRGHCKRDEFGPPANAIEFAGKPMMAQH